MVTEKIMEWSGNFITLDNAILSGNMLFEVFCNIKF